MAPRESESNLRLQWRLEALDAWRVTVEARLGVLERAVGEMVKADEIADAVAARMSGTRSLQLTRTQVRVAVGGLAVTAVGMLTGVAALVLTLTGVIGGGS